MNAPAPSPDEQAVIDRFGIFDEERKAATAVDVDALDAARAAATPGYWQLSPDGWTFAVQYENGLGYRVRDADAALIVAAVNALPELLAEVRRGRALREAVEGLADGAASAADLPVLKGDRFDAGVAATYRSCADRLRELLAAVDPPS